MTGLESIDPTDTHGMPVSSLVLSLDHGPLNIPNPADLLWAVQRVIGWVTLSILNVVSAFGVWLAPVVDLLERLSDAIYGTLGMIGVFGLACAVGLLVFVTHWLKGTTHKIAHHLGVALILTMVGVAMVSPVRWAVYAIGLGGQAANEVGTVVAQQPHNISVSQLLATKYLREPMFRANFGVNLDDVKLGPTTTCGDIYDSAVLHPWMVPDTNPVGEVTGSSHLVKPMEAVRDGCGQPFGAQAYAYAKDPPNIDYDLLRSGVLMLVLAAFTLVIAWRLGRTAVATVLHGAFIKPSLLGVVAHPSVQVIMLRNLIAIPLGFLAVFADMLLLVGVAAINGVVIASTGDTAEASLVTALMMASLIFGTWHFTTNLRGHGKKWSEQLAEEKIKKYNVSVQEARQMITKAVASPTQVSRGLSKALAGTAGRVPVPQFGWGPRSEQVLHDRGHYDSLPGGPGQPGLPGVAGRDASPVSAATATAERIHERIVRETHREPAAVASANGDRPMITNPEHARHQVVKELSKPPEPLPPPVQHAVRERKPAQIPILGGDATRRALDAVRAARRRKNQR